MPKFVAVSWNTEQLPLLIASVTGKKYHVEKTAVLKESRDLPAFVKEHHLAKTETLVIVERSDVEVRPMHFPSVPEDELPSIIAFQAPKEFNHYTPEDVLDFYPIENLHSATLTGVKPSSRTSVLAATLQRDVYENIRRWCNEADLTLQNIVLHPCESVFLWKQSLLNGKSMRHMSLDGYPPVLFVELGFQYASQTAVVDGEPVLMRSPRLVRPENVGNPEFAAVLTAELKRSRMAVHNDVPGLNLHSVVLCGQGEPYYDLAKQLELSLEMPVSVWEDAAGLASYLPHVGAVSRLARRNKFPVDFCHPKKAKPPAKQRNLLTSAVAAALVLVAVLFCGSIYYRMMLQNEVKELGNKFNGLKKSTSAVLEQKSQLKAVEDWRMDDVDWFKQLGWLSEKVPKAELMYVSELTMTANNGGSLTLKAQLKDSTVVLPMETGLTDISHTVKTGERGEVKEKTPYQFRCNLAVQVSKE